MVKGSCLCGAIKYQADEIEGRIGNCHCSICRKSHGAAFATQALVRGELFTFLEGEDRLSKFESSSGLHRGFCSICGSRLVNYLQGGSTYMSVALSSIDSVFDGKPAAHLCVASKASWYEINDDLPCFEDFPRELIE